MGDNINSDASPRSIFGMALNKVKNSTAAAKQQLQPQFQSLKTKTSKGMERVQPKIDRVVASASAGLERMQPTLEKAKKTTYKGWDKVQPGVSHFISVLKSSATPLAERVHSIAVKLSEQLITSPTGGVKTLHIRKVSARYQSLRFLLEYKKNFKCSPSPTAVEISRAQLVGDLVAWEDEGASKASSNSASKCMAHPYILFTILVFCGSLHDIAVVSMINQRCHIQIQGEQRLWKWCIRFGLVADSIRASFWRHISRTRNFMELAERKFPEICEEGKNSEWNEPIWIDVKRTYGRVAPHRRCQSAESGRIEQSGQETIDELQSQLSMVLYGLAGLYKDVGYCQGMDYVAAHGLRCIKTQNVCNHKRSASLLDIRMDKTTVNDRVVSEETEQTFWLLAVMFDQYGLCQMYSPGLEQLQIACYQFRRLFTTYLPFLAEHFHSENIIVEMIVVGWFQTLFMYMNAMPYDTLNRIWDIFLIERSWKIFFRVSLAILQLAEPFLDGRPIDQIMNLMNTFPGQMQEILKPEILINTALDIKITNKMLQLLADELLHTKSHTSH